MTTRRPTPIWGAASPAPFKCAMVSRISTSNSFKEEERKSETGSDFCHSRGSPIRSTSRIMSASSFLAALLDDAPHASHRFIEHCADLVERYGALAVAAAGGEVGHHGYGG